jgi:phage gp36-like protein
MFLEKSELKTVATDEIINKIINNDESIVTDIIAESIDVVSTYLYQYYDTQTIFATTGTNRNLTVLKHLKGIVIYEIYIRRTKSLNEVAKSRYDEALLWLEKVATGKIKPDLPVRVLNPNGDAIPTTFMKLGSRKTYQNHF